jgi:hypothetical protein
MEYMWATATHHVTGPVSQILYERMQSVEKLFFNDRRGAKLVVASAVAAAFHK